MTDCTCTNFPASLGNITFGASVGIGTAAPAGLLDVAGSGTDVACFVGPADDHYGTLVLRGGTSGTYWELAKLRSTDPAPDGWSLIFVTGTSSTPVLVATTAGQLGIGTTAPSKPLEVAGGAAKLAGGIVFGPTSQGGVPGMHSDGTSLYLEANAGALYLRPQGEGNNTNAAVLTAQGYLGVGTLTPEVPLHVVGTLLAAGLNGRLALGRNDGADPATSKTWQLDTDTNNDLRIFQQPNLTTVGTVYLTIQDGGNVGIGTQSPLAALDVDSSAAPQVVIRGGTATSVRLFPTNGSTSSVEAFATDDVTLASFSRLRLTVDGATAWIISDATGAPAMPLALQVGG